MKDLVIIGAGNVGGFLVLNQDLFKTNYNIIGFLDDDPAKLHKKFWNIPVLGTVRDIKKFEAYSIAIGISNPRIKKELVKKIDSTFNFPSFISKNAWISNKVTIGKGVIIYPGVSVNHESVIEDFVIINMNCAIGHDVTIQKNSSLAPGVNLGGFTYIEPNVDIGIGAATLQKIRIGEGAIIGGQTMLISSVAKGATVVGVPGRVIKI